MAEDDEEARRKRAEELRRAIEEAPARGPASPREFTDEQARKAADEEREPPDEEE
ncbi:MAG TPA: hypothetical protein VIM03_09035 [Thermoleophilaceae bacterium]|jgi:hypothetical protein